jgi:hypothetical protein
VKKRPNPIRIAEPPAHQDLRQERIVIAGGQNRLVGKAGSRFNPCALADQGISTSWYINRFELKCAYRVYLIPSPISAASGPKEAGLNINLPEVFIQPGASAPGKISPAVEG